MWILKFREKHIGCVYSPKCKRYGVVDEVYPITNYPKNGKIYLTALHLPKGKETAVRAYVNALKRDGKVRRLEESGPVFYTLVAEPAEKGWVRSWYNPEIFYVAPIVQDSEGYETVYVGSWDKGALGAMLEGMQENPDVYDELKVYAFKQATPDDIFVSRLVPKLSEKQRDALYSALEAGYYSFPRKADLKDLAKAARVSIPTFQEHIRRAEERVMPLLAPKYLKSKGK